MGRERYQGAQPVQDCPLLASFPPTSPKALGLGSSISRGGHCLALSLPPAPRMAAAGSDSGDSRRD